MKLHAPRTTSALRGFATEHRRHGPGPSYYPGAPCNSFNLFNLFNPHASCQRAVALVITLVLLSVITFMAVTFLVVSRSQHRSVATGTDQAIARLTADTARERAIAQLLAPIITWTNAYNYGLVVSTNYISSPGFTPGVSHPLNVNYDYTTAGASLNLNG